MYVICKSCGHRFNVSPPSGDLNLGGQTVNLGGSSINVNKVIFGQGGKLDFGQGGKLVFGGVPKPKYRCPQCGHEAEYSQDEIHND